MNYDAISKELSLTVKWGEFTYCSKQVVQDEHYAVHVSQVPSTMSIEYVDIDKTRRKRPDLPLQPEEVTSLRGSIGSLGWVARQLREDLLAQVSLLAQATAKPRIEHLVEANKCIRDARQDAEHRTIWQSSPDLCWDDICVFVNSDASLANADDDKTKSQCGYIVGLCNPQVLDKGDNGKILPLDMQSATIKRVCRSTLAAETNAALEGSEAALYTRMV